MIVTDKNNSYILNINDISNVKQQENNGVTITFKKGSILNLEYDSKEARDTQFQEVVKEFEHLV